MKKIYFLEKRTFEGFTYKPDREYQVSELDHAKLLQTFPMVIQDVSDAGDTDTASSEILYEEATESVAPVILDELVIESESSDVEELKPAADSGAGEKLEITVEETQAEIETIDLPGVPDKAIELLKAAGFISNDDVAGASDEELRAIEGIGPSYLEKIRAALN